MFSLESFYKSTIRRIEAIRHEILNAGISMDMQYHAWDSRGDVTELPNTDLIGLVGWGYDENEGLPTMQIGILVSMITDINQFREVKAMDVIRNTFVDKGGSYKQMPLVTPDLGVEYALLQVTNFEIMPAGRSENRSTRNVGVELIRASGD